jgi:hypothetical protein
LNAISALKKPSTLALTCGQRGSGIHVFTWEDTSPEMLGRVPTWKALLNSPAPGRRGVRPRTHPSLIMLLLLLLLVAGEVQAETLTERLSTECGCTDGTQPGCVPSRGGPCGHSSRAGYL